ncbi:MAG: sugar phosphate isomerase/epimerase family protein [Candidatus Woesearchaeota archaeon]
MVPQIGITTSTFDQKSWYREIASQPYRVLEIGRRSARMYLDPEWIAKIAPSLNGFDVSMHSGTTKIFTSNEQFTVTELETLKSEVVLCEMLGAKELVFHLKHDPLTDDEANRLRSVVDFAQERSVEMLYESNGILVADVALDFLARFPDVNYTLDLGHLNNGYGRGMLGCTIEEFVTRVRDRIVYVHAHNNSGTSDDHRALRDGTLNWRHVLDLLDPNRVRKIIMEVRTLEDLATSAEDLHDYYFSMRPERSPGT